MKEQTPPMYLAKLQIVNFAIFDNQEISFDPKFNAIIGETGSGKSLILDALQLIFGNRAEKKLIRKNKDFGGFRAPTRNLRFFRALRARRTSAREKCKHIFRVFRPQKRNFPTHSCAAEMCDSPDSVARFERINMFI